MARKIQWNVFMLHVVSHCAWYFLWNTSAMDSANRIFLLTLLQTLTSALLQYIPSWPDFSVSLNNLSSIFFIGKTPVLIKNTLSSMSFGQINLYLVTAFCRKYWFFNWNDTTLIHALKILKVYMYLILLST